MKENRANWEMQSGKFQTFFSMNDLIKDLHTTDFRHGIFICPHCNQIYYPDSATFICFCLQNR